MSGAPKKTPRKDVPNGDHVARYCNPQRIIRDFKTKEILGVFPQAFELRVKVHERYLSTHWMELLAPAVELQFKAVAVALRKKNFGLRPSAALAKLNAGLIVQAGAARGHSIRVRDRSTANDPGYSGIYGMPLDNSDLEFLAVLANECCIEFRGIAEIDALG